MGHVAIGFFLLVARPDESYSVCCLLAWRDLLLALSTFGPRMGRQGPRVLSFTRIVLRKFRYAD